MPEPAHCWVAAGDMKGGQTMSYDSKNSHAKICLFSPVRTEARSLRDILGDECWEVVWHDHGATLFDDVREAGVDLVIMSLTEDDARGQGLRTIEKMATEGIPTLVLAPGGADRHPYFAAGANDVVDAGIGDEELLCRVRVLLRVKMLCDDLLADQTQLGDILQKSQQTIDSLEIDNARLQQLCLTDALTGLCNVRSFEQMLSQEFRVAKRYNHPTSLLMLDMDHFTEVNNNYGHPSGDAVLKELAGVLRGAVRESDVVARLGGEEFAVLLPQTDAAQAGKLAERIRMAVAGTRFDAFGHEVRLTVSSGLATWPRCPEISDPEMLLYFADQALLLAKANGRNRVVTVSEMDVNVRRQMWKDYRRQTECGPSRDPSDVVEIAMGMEQSRVVSDRKPQWHDDISSV
jgi:diguanylate cyclase (GGDEF)-like protein